MKVFTALKKICLILLKHQINPDIRDLPVCLMLQNVFPHVLSMYSNVLLHSSMIALVVFQTLFLSIFTLKYKKKILFETNKAEKGELSVPDAGSNAHLGAATGCPRKFCLKFKAQKSWVK